MCPLRYWASAALAFARARVASRGRAVAPPAPQVAPIRRENRLPGHLMPCGRWSGTPSACPDDGLTSKDASLVTLGATRPAGWSADGESRVTLVVKVIVPRFGHKGANRISVALQLTLWHESQFTLASLKARATALCAKGHSALATIVAPWVRWATLSAAIFKNALRASCLRRPAAERRTVSRAHSRNGAQSRGHSLEGHSLKGAQPGRGHGRTDAARDDGLRCGGHRL